MAYLFREELTFVLEFKNGTRANLNNNNNTIKIPNDPDDRRKIDDFITIGILEIMLPLDATQVYCLAHWWNSTDVMKTSTHFETKRKSKMIWLDTFANETTETKPFIFKLYNRFAYTKIYGR